MLGGQRAVGFSGCWSLVVGCWLLLPYIPPSLLPNIAAIPAIRILPTISYYSGSHSGSHSGSGSERVPGGSSVRRCPRRSCRF